ncbi:MAG: sugar kinase [Armatimonadota bacterium]|nr:sugar kinase [Armatimonadota bacterium]
MSDVVCLGILVADVVGKPVDKWPGRGELELVDRMELHTGGCAANTGIALAKIGVDVAVIGKVGNDGFGDFMISRLKSHGIDPSGVVRSDRSNTSATMVMVHSDGERSFLHYFGANRDLVEDDVDMDLVAKSRILHVAGSFLMPNIDGQPTANILKKAKSLGVTTCLDTCWDATGKWMKVLAPCLPHIDYFLPSIAEAEMLTGKKSPADIAKALLDAGVGTVALKMGEEGSYIRTREAEMSVKPFDVRAIDALGAGDCFVAGFLTGLVNGWDLERTGKFANAVGAFCVTELGATTGVKDQATTEMFIRSQEGSSC